MQKNKKAPLGARLISYLIDSVIIYVISTPVLDPLTPVKNIAVISLIAGIYNLLLKSKTIGKRLMRIKVIYKTNTYDQIIHREIIWKTFIEKINIWLLFLMYQVGILDGFITWCQQSFIHQIIYYLVALPWIMFLSFAYMVQDENNDSLHDKYNKTRVFTLIKSLI
ncbi:RDD family protein [Acidaminobacter sp. JC074]|uniref:RDD family protein n=1 Tax=Acidaminobacter sp. JC074 TaxID=2530199 RepID=UPI001F0DD89A|nr:RDD family protein [Acidaminobacter sp. JC074]MCH4890146.1 RDD family protein [Acidaminobacter sp. JC074]